MNIIFENKKLSYIVNEVNYGRYKFDDAAAYVNGHYSNTNRMMPTKLYRDKKTGRPSLILSGKMFAVNPEDDKLIPKDILDKAGIK